ncbi:Wadjet anti-phage system protein JetD domain-containing protein [Paenibacillus albus]|uniref:Wadjet protein JetD C-terminal domain-containing protein n=1 Tax=Paenibacillus albus TaxID=2495582 RepID=A0A3S9A3W3_9BACL|nr:Wadjet anti-phage system protein JetD domain-containing protein [Paenibacillus albus]AZN40406.1 hypothetical protein EJC50_12660 [Paenibacillus albus]
MKIYINEFIERQEKKRFETSQLEKELKQRFKTKFWYSEFARALNACVDEGVLRPVQARGKNGMEPSLFLSYQIVDQEVVIREAVRRELEEAYTGYFGVDYYFKHPDHYDEDREALLQIKSYLADKDDTILSINERSYQLFNNEKWLEESARKFKKRIGLNLLDDLSCEDAPEPFMFLPRKTKVPPAQFNVLIIENKATFDSIRKLCKEGYYTFGGVEFHLFIYGEGNKIVGSFSFFYDLGLDDQKLTFYYFGDLDLEGIYIWHQLKKLNEIDVVPFTYFYRLLFEENNKRARDVGEGQQCSEEAIALFASYFDSEMQKRLIDLIRNRKCIPQEGLHRAMLREVGTRA